MQTPKDELQIARAMIEDLRDMNQVLTRQNHQLYDEIRKNNRHPAAIALSIAIRVIFVSSFLGVLAAFIRPQQLPNVLILGGWLGAAVYFINDDGYLF
jgi:hypothetical protein